MPYQAVIFDLDGTLLDTIEDIADAVNQVLLKYNYPTHDTESYKMMVGLGMDQLIQDALPKEVRDKATLERILKEAGDVYGRLWKNKSKPYPGVVALLEALREEKLRIAILSNKPHHFVQVCVEALLPSVKIDVILGAQDSILKKPAPDGALKIAEKLGMLPENILYVGDSGTDMRTAKAANMFAVGVSWGFRSTIELEENGADAVIQDPKALLAFI
ncbi:HAD family hydrolase [bacterium]|nr:HAD family hydrolase [bacterium]